MNLFGSICILLKGLILSKMGINKGVIHIFKKLFKEGFFNNINSVIELGSQEIHIEGIFLKGDLKKGESSKNFYDLLGIKKYECIDVDSRFEARMFDLNKDIEKTYNYKKKFDLVTNHGTTEHIFNQYMCFKNIHNLTKVGGYMWHGVPFIGYFDDSLYLYTPDFFINLAEDNNYKIEGMWIGITKEEFIIPYSRKEIEKYREEDVAIFCLLKKTVDSLFKTPFQNRYKETSKLQNERIKEKNN